MTSTLPSPSELRKAVLFTLRKWDAPTLPHPTHLSTLYIVQSRRRQTGESTTQAIRAILQAAIDVLAHHRPDDAALLQEHFQENRTLLQIIQIRGETGITTEDQLDKRQRRALLDIATYLLELERETRTRQIESLLTVLPPLEGELFGVADTHALLVQAITNDTAPPFTIISGLGGIGKTALANVVGRDVLATLYFENSVWIQINPRRDTLFPPDATQMGEAVIGQLCQILLSGHTQSDSVERVRHLQHVLKAKPTLVIVDNIEHHDELPLLLQQLTPLAQPTKFLLTSRVRTTHTMAQDFPLGEIDEIASIALLQRRALLARNSFLKQSSIADLATIYEITGGHPQALILVAGLAESHPVGRIVANLRLGRNKDIEALYNDIYTYIWETLSDDARIVLQVLAMNSESGISFEHLRVVSHIDDTRLSDVVTELHRRAVMEVRPHQNQQPRYGVHRLTERYVRRDILHLESA